VFLGFAFVGFSASDHPNVWIPFLRGSLPNINDLAIRSLEEVIDKVNMLLPQDQETFASL